MDSKKRQYSYLRKNCYYCKKPFTKKEIAARKESIKQNALRSRAKAEAKGKRVGRRKQGNTENIIKLRESGYSVKQIAAIEGTSIEVIYRRLQEIKNEKYSELNSYCDYCGEKLPCINRCHIDMNPGLDIKNNSEGA